MGVKRMKGKFLAVLLLACLLSACASAEDVFYEIFPGSFYDSNGDGIGDIRGVLAKIDYIESLGVKGVWLTPIHPSPTYHKYDVIDYLSVDPSLGTVEDVQALADALHSRNMILLSDLVLNHTSDQNPWFKTAINALAQSDLSNPFIAYYHFENKAVPGWHAVPDAPGWYYEGSFSSRMPDLNLDHEPVREEILRICRYWMSQGVDGFRLDAVLFYYAEHTARNIAFLQWLMENLREIKPDVYVVGEVWKDAGTIGQYYESGISSLFNFPFAGPEGAIVKAIREGKGATLAKRIADWQSTWAGYPNASDAPFLSNHDIARIAGTLMQKPDQLKLAASLYLTMPGTPFLYYGEEIGMTGSGRDENKRLPMLWSDDSTGACEPPEMSDQFSKSLGTVEAQLMDPDSLLNHYRTLIALRKQYPAFQNGILRPLDTGNPALCAYALDYGDETVYVLHNLCKKAAILAWEYEPILSLGVPDVPWVDGMLEIPPMASVIAK